MIQNVVAVYKIDGRRGVICSWSARSPGLLVHNTLWKTRASVSESSERESQKWMTRIDQLISV